MSTWFYPEPIMDLEAWRATGMDLFDPSHAHRLFWPDRPYRPDMDILSAGCGPSQAAVIAFTNPSARVVSVETSPEVQDHNRHLKDKHGLTNLELHLLPAEEVGTLGRTFDLVITSRVFNHTAAPRTVMAALGQVLRPDGVAAIMLLARYGRSGVQTMQSVFGQMGLRADEQSLQMVRAGLNFLNPSHPARVYLSMLPGLGSDAGLVETFLRGPECSYSVNDALELVEGAGLVFQDWLNKSAVHPPTLLDPANEFLAAVDGLPARRMWSVMEQMVNLNDNHTLIACRPDRPERAYRIDFASPTAADYVPVWRANAGTDAEKIFRIGLAVQPVPEDRAFAELVDGTRSIRAIAGGHDVEKAVDFFQKLWRLDFIAIELR